MISFLLLGLSKQKTYQEFLEYCNRITNSTPIYPKSSKYIKINCKVDQFYVINASKPKIIEVYAEEACIININGDKNRIYSHGMGIFNIVGNSNKIKNDVFPDSSLAHSVFTITGFGNYLENKYRGPLRRSTFITAIAENPFFATREYENDEYSADFSFSADTYNLKSTEASISSFGSINITDMKNQTYGRIYIHDFGNSDSFYPDKLLGLLLMIFSFIATAVLLIIAGLYSCKKKLE